MHSILFNGEVRQFDAPISVGLFLEKMGLKGKRVAVECNGRVIPRSMQENTFLKQGDRVEVIVAVGGG